MTRTEREDNIYRAPQNKYGALLAAAGAAIFIVLAAQGGSGLIPASIFAALLGLFAWRAAVAGIHPVSGGVKVVNIFNTKFVAWGDIDRFTVAPSGRYPYTGHVILRDGTDLPCVGLGTGRLPRQRSQVEQPIAALNRLLDARRGVHQG